MFPKAELCSVFRRENNFVRASNSNVKLKPDAPAGERIHTVSNPTVATKRHTAFNLSLTLENGAALRFRGHGKKTYNYYLTLYRVLHCVFRRNVVYFIGKVT